MLSNRTTQWTLGAAVLCVAILAGSWFMLIAPRRAHAADLRNQAVAAAGEVQLAQTKTAQLRNEFADLPKQKAELAAIKAQLTPKADMSTLVTDLQRQASAAGVALNSIVPGSPVVVGAASGSATSATLAAAGSVVSIPLTLTATGDYFEDSLFTKYLQTKLTRAFLVNNVSTAASQSTTSTPTATSTATPTVTATTSTTSTTTGSSGVSLSVTGSVFVLLDSTSTLGQVAKDAQQATTGSSS